MIDRWERYWFGPVAAVRPYLFLKCFLLLIGIDALVLMTERGARYGVDGFNVAHFAWLDAIQPLPVATWYVGILMLVATLAFTMAMAGAWRPGLVALDVLYTYGWAMSRHDSYLHHYMSTLILTALILFPRITARDVLEGKPEPARTAQTLGHRSSRRWWTYAIVFWAMVIVYRSHPQLSPGWWNLAVFAGLVVLLSAAVWVGQPTIAVQRTSAWGYRLLGATVGVIYVYTAVAKMDWAWCSGHTIRQVGDVTRVLGPVEQLAGWIGIPSAWFWSTVATAVIPVELLIALSYFLAIRQDEPDAMWIRRWCVFGWLLATGLHLNNEMMNLSIQWFSHYMIFLAAFFLGPLPLWMRLSVVVLWPAYCAQRWLAGELGRAAPGAFGWRIVLAVAVVAAASMAAAAWRLDLPGGWWALPVAAAAAVLGAAMLTARGQTRPAIRLLAGTAAAGCLIHGIALFSSLRFDYYDLLGRTVQRLGSPDPSRSGLEDAAEVQARLHRQAEAIVAFSKALELLPPSDPRRALVYNNLGLAYRRLGQWHRFTENEQQADALYRKAEACYAKAMAADPSDPLPHYNLGVTFQEQGKLDDAISQYQQALRIKPDLSDALVNLGVIFEQLGDLQAALRHLQWAHQIEPQAPDIQSHLERLQPLLARPAAGETHSSVPHE